MSAVNPSHPHAAAEGTSARRGAAPVGQSVRRAALTAYACIVLAGASGLVLGDLLPFAVAGRFVGLSLFAPHAGLVAVLVGAPLAVEAHRAPRTQRMLFYASLAAIALMTLAYLSPPGAALLARL